MADKAPVHGDGIGPEIMAATLHILENGGGRRHSIFQSSGRMPSRPGSRPGSEKIVRYAFEYVLQRMGGSQLDFIQTEHLYTFNGEKGFSE